VTSRSFGAPVLSVERAATRRPAAGAVPVLALLAGLTLLVVAYGCRPSGGEGFALYLPAKEVPVSLLPALSHIEIAEAPLISEADILSYSGDIHQIELTSEAYDRIVDLDVPVSGRVFVVCVDHHPAYTGAFWTPISSISFNGVVILKPTASARHVIQLLLGYPSSQFFSGKDPRASPAVLRSLQRASKLH
jgi:hypothetical protein